LPFPKIINLKDSEVAKINEKYIYHLEASKNLNKEERKKKHLQN